MAKRNFEVDAEEELRDALETVFSGSDKLDKMVKLE